MTKAEKIQKMRESGYSEFYIKSYAESLDRIARLNQCQQDEEVLSHEETVLFLEKCKKENRERAIKQWKDFKYNGIWPFTSLDSSSFIKDAHVDLYEALYNHFKRKIGDEIDDL